jgi:cell division septation protein DedD
LSQQPRVEAQAAGVPAPAPAGQWVIQTGVFASARRAENVVEQLTAIGYPAFHRQQTFISHGTLEVAFAGPYPTQAQADTERMTLRRVPGFEDAHVRELR